LSSEFGKQFCVGHSFVTPPIGESIDDFSRWFNEVVETELKPLLEEYWFEAPQKASEAIAELTRSY
jgi:5-methylcytosine-specific restriction protein B